MVARGYCLLTVKPARIKIIICQKLYLRAKNSLDVFINPGVHPFYWTNRASSPKILKIVNAQIFYLFFKQPVIHSQKHICNIYDKLLTQITGKPPNPCSTMPLVQILAVRPSIHLPVYLPVIVMTAAPSINVEDACIMKSLR